jgi:hypothetical protein
MIVASVLGMPQCRAGGRWPGDEWHADNRLEKQKWPGEMIPAKDRRPGELPINHSPIW